MNGIELIAAERERQIARGFDADHDAYANGLEKLAQVAACYATPPDDRKRSGHPPEIWPSGWVWMPKPNDRVRELVMAGALIAAEIDRLQRANP